MTGAVSITRVGRSAALIEFATLAEVVAWGAALADRPAVGVTEIVPGARTILVRFSAKTTFSALANWIKRTSPNETAGADTALVRVPVVYDGEDVDEVAEILGCSREGVVRRHTSADYRVAFTGFAPGFAYLTDPHAELQVPRRGSPRPRVAAGSVGLAGEFSGVYPRESPGGWQLIGRTDAILFDAKREPPALLTAATRVRFDAVREIVSAANAPQAPAPQQPHVRVLAASVQTTIQDLGRSGFASIGVTASGAADRASHRSANEAVGNPHNAASIEITMGGVTLEFLTAAVIALTGAKVSASVENAEGYEYDIAMGTPLLVTAGSTVTIGYAMEGWRTYLAVRGGWETEPVMGSRATDTLAGLGPTPLRAGTELRIASVPQFGVAATATVAPSRLPSLDTPTVVRVALGPRQSWFTRAAIRTFLGQMFEVSAVSDRVGLRLRGESVLQRLITAELPSEGVLRGSIQVPNDSNPVIFLADHPVTGGYPVIAVVDDRDLDLLGQLPPGAKISFQLAAVP